METILILTLLLLDLEIITVFVISSWTEGTIQDSHGSSKTAWPIPRLQSMFLPEFPIKEIHLKTGYNFLDVIARGAYGKVYKIQKQNSGQVFALKVISKATIVAGNAVVQAKQEVYLTYRLEIISV